MTTVLLLAGSRVNNRLEHGEKVPADWHIEPCIGCRAATAITPSGAARLARGRAEGNAVGVICSFCASALPRVIESVETTAGADRQASENPAVRKAIEFLRSKVKP